MRRLVAGCLTLQLIAGSAVQAQSTYAFPRIPTTPSCDPMQTRCSPVEARHSPADSQATVRYVGLLRAEITATDVAAANQTSECERIRLLRVFTQRIGHTYAMGVLEGARERAFRDVPDSMRVRRDARLAQVTPDVSDEACTTLARSGVLGDSMFPPAPQWKP